MRAGRVLPAPSGYRGPLPGVPNVSTLLRCPACAATSPASATAFRCACGEPLDVVHPGTPRVDRGSFDARLAADPWGSGVWRYKELVHPALPDDAIVSRPEGNTPLLHAPAVTRYAGVDRLRLKHEGMNPTGSFKDRGMTVAVSQGVASGARAFVCASTGNTSAAVAAYAAICGVPAIILVPEGATATGKLTQALAYGARTVLIRGDFDDAMALVQRAAPDLGWYLLNSLNPFRLQGQKTIVLETLQQLGWEPPDWIAFPAGNLGNCSAFGQALVEARELGLIDRIPRLLAVQAAGAAPLAAAWRDGLGELRPVRPETVATAIRIGDPVSYHRAVRALRATDGVVTAVEDAAILDAKAVIDAAGVGAEPASCAAVAGVRQMVAEGVVAADAHVVAVLTGHLLKDPDTTFAYHTGRLDGPAAARGDLPDRSNPPVTIEPTLEALRAVSAQGEPR